MAGKSYIQLINKIETVVSDYILVKKFVSEFEDELQNKLTETEEYYAVAVCPTDNPMTLNSGESTTNTLRARVYCLGTIQADRANVMNLCSDASLILQDLFNELKEGNDYDFEVETDLDIIFVNNSMVDYLAGAYFDLGVIVQAATQCEIPKISDYEA